MPVVNVKDESLHKALKEYAEKEGKPLQDVVNDVIFDFLFKQGKDTIKVEDEFIKKDDYEAMAITLVKTFMPTHIREFSDEICDVVLKVPHWQHLLGMYRWAYDTGQFPAPLIDSGWNEASGAAWKDKKNSCKHCGEEFKPKFLGQLFCSNQCAAQEKRAAA